MTTKKLNSIIFNNIITNPIHIVVSRVRKNLELTVQPLFKDKSICLDVGCGSRPYEYLFKSGKYVGVDIEQSGRPLNMKNPDYFYDGKTLPFENNEFDMVLCTQVLEHVPDPQALLKEISRVCKIDGDVVISLPFVYPEHEQPFDYFRFSQFGVKELFKNAHLEVKEIKKDTNTLESLAILLNVYIITNLDPGIRGVGRLYSILLCFPIQLLALLLSKILPDKQHLYLNLIIHAKKSN